MSGASATLQASGASSSVRSLCGWYHSVRFHQQSEPRARLSGSLQAPATLQHARVGGISLVHKNVAREPREGKKQLLKETLVSEAILIFSVRHASVSAQCLAQ
jgi:hypothetical protein